MQSSLDTNISMFDPPVLAQSVSALLKRYLKTLICYVHIMQTICKKIYYNKCIIF
jgi:hypothetical protein